MVRHVWRLKLKRAKVGWADPIRSQKEEESSRTKGKFRLYLPFVSDPLTIQKNRLKSVGDLKISETGEAALTRIPGNLPSRDYIFRMAELFR